MIDIGNVLILGDSYSTFEGSIPDGFAIYYYKNKDSFGINSPADTWWGMLFGKVKANLVLNCSWSGTTICNTGYNGDDYSDKSFIYRFDKLVADGFFEENKIDTMILFGGTNDCWAYSPIGEKKMKNWTKEDLYYFKPAFCYLIDRIRKELPKARLISILNTHFLPEFDNAIKGLSEELKVETIVLNDIEKTQGHPNKKGMEQICEQVLEHLKTTKKCIY